MENRSKEKNFSSHNSEPMFEYYINNEALTDSEITL